jgi:hypothetical protein
LQKYVLRETRNILQLYLHMSISWQIHNVYKLSNGAKYNYLILLTLLLMLISN